MLSLKSRIKIAMAQEELRKGAEAAVEQPQLSTVGQRAALVGAAEAAFHTAVANAEKAKQRALFARLFEHGRTGDYMERGHGPKVDR
jgi:hypothetical protein